MSKQSWRGSTLLNPEPPVLVSCGGLEKPNLITIGWTGTICIVCFVGGVQLVCLGVIGEYIGKIYMETKARPRYIISERTWAPYERKYHG